MKYLKNTIFTISLMTIFILIVTILYYFDLISPSTNRILKIVSYFLILLASGISIGKKAKSKAYLDGIKQSLILILISLLFSIITKNTKITLVLYYLILSLVTIFGSVIGINFKKKH